MENSTALDRSVSLDVGIPPSAMEEAAPGFASVQNRDCTPESGLSVKEAFKGATVLLTGVTGYVGSLVLEQLLRVCPDVAKVYVLIRGKRNRDAHARLELLVNSGLFNKLWDKPEVLAKIEVIEGDVTVPDLGLSPENKAEVLRSVQFVIHSAAAVALDDPIQMTLTNNYVSTQNVLELCRKMVNMKAYTHVSTAFVGITFPKGSVVKEKIYPMMNGDARARHKDIVSDLLRLPEKEAGIKADLLMDRWNFPNTYCLGKHLAEQLVADYHKSPFPCSIVRPSLISGVDKDPYPGYIGNLAGGAGFAIAFAVGFFERWSYAWNGTSVADGVPGDVVSSVILAAAASTATKRIKEDEVGIFHACTSTTYPITNYEMHRAAYDFFTREPPQYCLLWGGYSTGPTDYEPHPILMPLAKTVTRMKVHAVCWLLGRLGKDRIAKKLYTGWRAWDFANQTRYDMNLFFSTDNVKALDAMLVKEEKKDIRCLYTVMNGDWIRYGRTYLAGVKKIMLKSDVKDNSNHDFRYIPPCDPPLSLPRNAKNCSSSDDWAPGSKPAGAKRTQSVSATSLSELAMSLGGESEKEEGFESDLASESEGEENKGGRMEVAVST